MKVKKCLIYVMILTVSFLNGMSEVLQQEITQLEDDLVFVLMGDFNREDLVRIHDAMFKASEKLQASYPKGIIRQQKDFVCMMRLKNKAKFLEDCTDYLLGGEETEAVKQWKLRDYGDVYLGYRKNSQSTSVN